jgi:hypothetical protein
MVYFKDLVDRLTMQERVDEVTGISRFAVADSRDVSRTERRIISAWKAERHEREACWEDFS